MFNRKRKVRGRYELEYNSEVTKWERDTEFRDIHIPESN